ncbi:trypsin-like peptidase domain-containing protein [bacterium]|nr:trypsin-like peptidase domain-containing protein [bacterium]
MKFLLTLSLVLVGLNSFANNNDIEKIIGENDLIAVDATGSNVPERYRSIIDGFGRMSMGCTATHIGNGYVLTAGHCFYADTEPSRDLECSDTTIEWGVREGVEPYLTSTCEKIIIAQTNETENDYALLKVSPVPAVAIGVEMQRKAIIGDSLTMFSHPEVLPLRWSQQCGIEREQHPDLPPGAFQHKCDTNPGSSGATILDLITLKVIGIHDGGVVNGSGGANYGTFIMNSPLFEELKKAGF